MTITHRDQATGEEIDGKAYLLRTTEGTDLVDPRRLFAFEDGGAALEAMRYLVDRVAALETAVAELREPSAGTPAESGPEPKRAPRQRKAAD